MRTQKEIEQKMKEIYLKPTKRVKTACYQVGIADALDWVLGKTEDLSLRSFGED